MSALRDIWADLVDKRLWPVLLALVLGLIAVPVLLLDPAAQPKAPVTPLANAGPAPLVSDPSAITAARPGGPVGGDFKNPFKQQHVPADPTARQTTSSAGPGTGESTSGSGGSSGKGKPDSSGGGPGRGRGGDDSGPGPEPKPDSGDGVTKLKVRFGRSDGSQKVMLLAPGEPLPTGSDPLIVFHDLDSRKRAEFVIASEVQPEGDGTCKPSKTVCAQLFLSKGQTEFFDVALESGAVQYQLEVLGVVKD